MVSVKFLTQCVFFTALKLDKKGVIETAHLSFRSLLGVLGIEAALESLIKSLCIEKNTSSQIVNTQESDATPEGM